MLQFNNSLFFSWCCYCICYAHKQIVGNDLRDSKHGGGEERKAQKGN